MDRTIPLCIPNFEGNEQKYVDDALAQGWVSTGGAYITRLEKGLAAFMNIPEVAACQSGTAALHLALREAGVGRDDVVIVPPVTFIAAVNPVKYQGAVPVFVDCDDSLCMDPEKLRLFCRTACTFDGETLRFEEKPVKAIVVVHVFGNMADMESIMDIAGEYHLAVVEDATEALGSRYISGRYAGRYAGTIGDFGAFSFNGNKVITTGGGGAVTAHEVEKTRHMRYLSTQAKDDPHYYVHHEIGYNYRMTNLQAALGVAQMEELPEFIRRKQNNYARYLAEFESFTLGKLLPFREGSCSNHWFYSLVIDRSRIQASMREIITGLEKDGVQTRAIWDLINKQIPYQGEKTFLLEKAPYYAERVLNLPCSTSITEEEILYVCQAVKRLLTELSESAEKHDE